MQVLEFLIILFRFKTREMRSQETGEHLDGLLPKSNLYFIFHQFPWYVFLHYWHDL